MCGAIAAHISSLCSVWKWVVSFTLHSFYTFRRT